MLSRVYAPETQEREARGHQCGKCRNPFTGGREDCPNNKPKEGN